METASGGGLQAGEAAAAAGGGSGRRPRGKCELKCAVTLDGDGVVVFHRVVSLCGCAKLLSDRRET